MMFMGLGDATSDCNDKCNSAYIADSSPNASDTWNSCLAACQPSAGGLSVGASVMSGFLSSGGATAPSAGGWNTSAPGAQAQSGWSQALQALTAGVTSGAANAIIGQTPHPAAAAPAPTPWYMTPMGIIGIVLVIGGGAWVLAKK